MFGTNHSKGQKRKGCSEDWVQRAKLGHSSKRRSSSEENRGSMARAMKGQEAFQRNQITPESGDTCFLMGLRSLTELKIADWDWGDN